MSAKLHSAIQKLLLITGVTVCAFVLIGAIKVKDAKPCSEVVVHYRANTMSGFVPYADVLSLISDVIETKPVGHPLKGFDLNGIEAKLEENPWVYDAQLYFDNRQKLHVVLMEAIPVARCMDKTGKQYYLDAEGKPLPLSKQYRADVPVFTGMPVKAKTKKDSLLMDRVCRLAEAIMADSFWLAQATQIEVLPNGKMELIPAIGSHFVDIGEAEKPYELLQKLKIFYKAIAASGRLGDFKRLNASFDRQIVAQMTERDWEGTDKKEAMVTYQKIVSDNKTEVNANSVVAEKSAGRIVNEAPIPKTEDKPKISTKPATEKAESIIKEQEQIKATEKPQEKAAEKEPAEKKIPKAIMPKLEGN
jgi:cell division protein FtsQ